MSLFVPEPHFPPVFKPLSAPVYPLDGDPPNLRWLPCQAYVVRILLVVLSGLSSALGSHVMPWRDLVPRGRGVLRTLAFSLR
jgi:hypothetical protein